MDMKKIKQIEKEALEVLAITEVKWNAFLDKHGLSPEEVIRSKARREYLTGV